MRWSAIPTPTPHRTETKKSEANQAEGSGFGDVGRKGYLIDCKIVCVHERAQVEGELVDIRRIAQKTDEDSRVADAGVEFSNGKLPGGVRSADRSRTLASSSPSFYWKMGDGCSNPPELARFVVSSPPSLSYHLMVVRLGASSDNELRMMRPSAICGTKARVTGDDDFVTGYHDE